MVSPFEASSLKNRIFLVVQALAEQSSISVSPEYITSMPIVGGKKPTKQQTDQSPPNLSEEEMAAVQAVVNGDATVSATVFSAGQSTSAPTTQSTTVQSTTVQSTSMPTGGTY